MQSIQQLLCLLALIVPVFGHFKLNEPPSRADIDDTEIQSPCGGAKPVAKSKRGQWNVKGGQLEIDAGHDQANMAVYMALDNDNPNAADFNFTIAQPFLQVGLGTFCWNFLTIPANVTSHIKSGMNATIQVVQQSEDYPNGLYNCADITFTDDNVSTSTCKNGSGVTAKPLLTGSASASSTSPAATATSSSAATLLQAAGGVALAGAVAVGALVL